MTLVYCRNCSYFDDDSLKCNHPKERIVVTKGTPIDPPVMATVTRCSDKNRNNNCSDYYRLSR